MLKYIGIIGYGIVGRACHMAFEHNTDAIIIDPKYSDNTTEQLSLYCPRVIFVALPAPTLSDRTVDASIIYDVFQQLTDIKYKGLVVLKSTLPPDIVDDLYVKFGNSKVDKKKGPLRYIYSPVFLREAEWEKDALEPAQIIIAGDFFDCKELEEIYKNHSHIRYTKFQKCHYKEAALVKYAINSFLATKVVFMNQLYKLYADMYNIKTIRPELWDIFADMLISGVRIDHSNMTVPDKYHQFGYGGSCFPKDISAMIGFDKNERMSVLRDAELANTQIRLTEPSKSE